jgi:uncharacterized protein
MPWAGRADARRPALRTARNAQLHFLLAFVAYAALFLLVTLSIQHLSGRVAAVLWVSALLGGGLPLVMPESVDVLAVLLESGKSAFMLAAVLVVVTYPPVFKLLIEILWFFVSNSGSTYRSRSSSSWGRSSSSSGSSWGGSSSSRSSSSGSSSGTSWGGGGGGFGGGGASSSW